MKFPVAFRIFGVINLIASLVLAVQTIILYANAQMGFWAVSLSAALSLWLLIVAFIWLFASDKSYAGLYHSAILILAMAFFFFVGFSMTTTHPSTGDMVFLAVYLGLALIYALFMLVTMFFKPVKEWMKAEPALRKPFDLAISGIFVVVVGVCMGAFTFLGKSFPKTFTIEEFYGLEASEDGCYTVNLSYLSEFNRITLSTEDPEAPETTKVVLYFADDYNAPQSTDYFDVATIDLKKVGYTYEGQIDPTWVRKLHFCGTTGNGAGVQFSSLVLSREMDRFSPKYEANFIMSHEAPYEAHDHSDEYGDEDMYGYSEALKFRPEYPENPDGAPVSIGAASALGLVELFFEVVVDNYETSNRYDFNDPEVVNIRGKSFGTYQNFRTLFENNLGETISRYQADAESVKEEISLNEAVRRLTGVNLYNPEPYEGSEFLFNRLNPALVDWLHQNMMLATDEAIYEQYGVGYLYTKLFRRTFWVLAATHEYLEQGENLSYEARLYLEAMDTPDFYGPGYLYNRFGDANWENTPVEKFYTNFPSQEDEYFYFNEGEAIGFWLRRHLDGSYPNVVKLMKTIMANYDEYPFEDQ